MTKNSNTNSTQSSSRKNINVKFLLDELYKSADPLCIKAGMEIQSLNYSLKLTNKNLILLINALLEIEYIAHSRDNKRKVTADQLNLRLNEIARICGDVGDILNE